MHPDLDVKDSVSRPASAIHPDSKLPYSEAFPQEWAQYLEQKERERELRPHLQAIPGMTIGPGKELMDLGINDCHDLLAYEGDLGDLERFRELAKRIVALVDEYRAEPKIEPKQADVSYISPETGVVIPMKPAPKMPDSFNYEFTV